MKMNSTRQRGISLVPALFLLIVLAALGIVAVKLTAVQQQTVVLSMKAPEPMRQRVQASNGPRTRR